MEYDTTLSAEYAGGKLDSLIERSHRDTLELVEKNDIPLVVKHFARLRDEYRTLKNKLERLEKEVDDLSYNIIPTMFDSQQVKTIKLDDIGRVTVNQRWVASMPDKQAGMAWLRETGNDGLIIQTVNAQTLAAFAKTQAIAGAPLPDNVFTIGVAPFVSITKG